MIRAVLIWVALTLLPLSLFAQDTRSAAELDDRGYVQAFLEDNLSGVGRDIRITGFEGALSSRATVQQITVADDEGVWLTLNNVGLGWNRAEILRGVLDISELSAEEILFTRPPMPVAAAPTPEAAGFSLPDLPVSIDVERISAPRIVIGQEVFGQAATLQLDGAAQLAAGSGSTRLTLARLDGPEGRFEIDGSFANATRQLDLSILLKEAADGIAANLIGLPGHPALGLSVEGSGPLSDFTAEVALETDGVPRLAGQVKLADNPAGDQILGLTLSGDIAPVFLPEYRAFFGENVLLQAEAARGANGGLRVDALDLRTRALRLTGTAVIDPQGWPERFDLIGRLADTSGVPVLLPLSGPKTYVQSGDLHLQFDARESEDWNLAALLNGVVQGDAFVKEMRLSGVGQIVPTAGDALGQVAGDLGLAVQGIDLKDPALARAIGPQLDGKLRVDWRSGEAVRLSGLDLTSGDMQLRGGVELDEASAGLVMTIGPELRLTAADLSRFAPLTGQPLSGAAELALTGQANLLGGAFDLRVSGLGDELAIGQPKLDPLLAGRTQLDISAVRDDQGARLPVAIIANDQAELTLSADLKTGASRAEFFARIKDAATVDPGLSGPVQLAGTAVQADEIWQLDVTGTGPGGADLRAQASVQTDKGVPGLAKGEGTGKIARLSALRGVIGQPLSGGIEVTAQGQFDMRNSAFELMLDGTGRDLAIGNPMLDPLTSGQSTLSLSAHREAGAPVLLDQLDLTTREVTVTATGDSAEGRHALRFEAKLRDLALLADGVSGAASAQGVAVLNGDRWQIDVTGQGPNQANIAAKGAIASDASRGDLSLTGSLHLGLLNPMIRPRVLTGKAALDLALNGPLTLSSVTGQVTVAGGQLVLPAYNVSLDLTQAVARLNGGRAQLDVLAGVTSGGQITARGSVGLSAPFDADIQMQARQVHLSDGTLYDTTFDGTAALRGPLNGGAAVRAEMTLGATEIRIPEATPSAVPIMADLEHVNTPADVRRTLKNAGLLTEPGTDQTGLVYPLEITINAPSRIFVRGRGLDAELGGSLRITGTSANVIPQGRFELVRGRLDILGKRLDLTTGQVGMQGSFDPMLYFVATSQTDAADVSITVDGPASDPTVSFSSVPDRPQDEVLALLLFGRDITKISPLQALQMAAAVRTLAGKGGDGIVGKLRGSFALDDLDVSTDESGVTNVRAGKYISENIYTDVVVGSDGTSEVNLNLNISPSVKARGSVSSDGESKLGIFFERDY